MGNGCFICTDGHLALCLCSHQHRGVKRRGQYHGVFLPEHVQRVRIRLNGGEVERWLTKGFRILYGWTPEAYPAPIRGTACGVASFWGRLFSIVSPLIGTHLLATSVNGPLYLAGSGVFVCTVCIALMPRKFMGAKSY